MGTLDLVCMDNVMMAILNTVTGAGFLVLEADQSHIVVKGGCLPVSITWETCLCHGGRIWLLQENTNIHIELSSDTYDTEKGIDSPETELAWRIDNELVDAIDSFKSYVYVVDTYGSKYSNDPEKHERRYFKNMEGAAYYIFDEWGHDIYTTEDVTHLYPNENVRLCVKYDHDEGEKDGKARRIHFKCKYMKRDGGEDYFKVQSEYEQVFWVYRKGLMG